MGFFEIEDRSWDVGSGKLQKERNVNGKVLEPRPGRGIRHSHEHLEKSGSQRSGGVRRACRGG